MDPNAPPAPPPISPQPNDNKYDFIMNPPVPKKKGLLPSGNSQFTRIIVVVVGALLLLTLVIVVASVISSAGKADTENLVLAAKQQNELVRVADIGIEKAKTQAAKDIAITTKLSLSSQQTDMKDALKTAGRKLSDKELAASKNSKTDTALTTAEQNNRFDEEFLVVMNTGLTQYQRTIKKAYEGAKSQKLKSALATQFESANTLAGAASSN